MKELDQPKNAYEGVRPAYEGVRPAMSILMNSHHTSQPETLLKNRDQVLFSHKYNQLNTMWPKEFQM